MQKHHCPDPLPSHFLNNSQHHQQNSVHTEYVIAPSQQSPNKATTTTATTTSADSKVVSSSSAQCFLVHNLLSQEECQYLIKRSEDYGYDSIDQEYPTHYRNSSRAIVLSETWKDWLWSRLTSALQSTVKNQNGANSSASSGSLNWEVKPFGFDNNGRWVSIGLNECFRFSKYQQDEFFKPHIDGMFVRNRNERSIFSIIVYLNDNYEGGELEMYSMDDSVKVTDLSQVDAPLERIAQLKVKAGTAVIFNQDLPHCGSSVTQGTKYIVRTDIMFRRVENTTTAIMNDTLAPYDYETSEEYKQAVQLLLKSDEMERQGNVEEATKLYLEAQALQARMPSSSVLDARNVESRELAHLEKVPDDAMILLLEYMEAKDTAKFMRCNRNLYYLCQNSRIWRQYYQLTWPLETTSYFELLSCGNKQDQQSHNWYRSYRIRSSNSIDFRALIISINPTTISYGYLDGPRESIPMLIGRPDHPHFSMTGFGVDDYVIGDMAENCYHISREEVFVEDTIDIHLLRNVMDYLYDRKLNVEPSMHPVVFTVSPNVNPNALNKVATMFFDSFMVPAVKFIDEATAYSTAIKDETCLLVRYDDNDAYCAPIHNNVLLRQALRFSKSNGSVIKKYIHNSVKDGGMRWVSSSHVEQVRESMYVAMNYEEEVKTVEPLHVASSYGSALVPEAVVKAPEIIFNPNLVKESTEPGIIDLIVQCAELVRDENVKQELLNKITLSGPYFSLQNMVPRMVLELSKHFTDFNVQLGVSQDDVDADDEEEQSIRKWASKPSSIIWEGAKTQANLSNFRDSCTTIACFNQNNGSLYHREKAHE